MRANPLVAALSATLPFLVVGSPPAQADVFTWTGFGPNNDWTTPNNWRDTKFDPVSPPSDPATSVVFGLTDVAHLTPNQNIGARTELNGITFSLAAHAGTRGFDLRGQPVALVANAGANPFIRNNDLAAPTQTISMGLEFASPAAIGGIGTANLILSGALSGAAGFTFNSMPFLNAPGGGLTLTGNTANTYGGTTTIEAGNVALAKPAGKTAIPGDLVIGNGLAAARVTMTGVSQQISGSSNVTVNAMGTLTLSSAVGSGALTERIATLQGAGNVDLGAGNGNPFGLPRNTLSTGGNGLAAPFSGVISGGGNFTKIGDSTLVLTGNNTYTGPTRVEGGVLTVNGPGHIGSRFNPITVARGTLNGTGTISGQVIVHTGAHFQPGNTPGILTIDSGGIELQPGANFDEEISRGSLGPRACADLDCYSRLDVTGGTTLAGSFLNVTLDAAPIDGDLFGIIDNNDGASMIPGNTFAGLPQGQPFGVDFGGSRYTFEISYQGAIPAMGLPIFDCGLACDDVVLRLAASSPVPEPSSAAMLLTGTAALLGLLATTAAGRRPRPPCADQRIAPEGAAIR